MAKILCPIPIYKTTEEIEKLLNNHPSQKPTLILDVKFSILTAIDAYIRNNILSVNTHIISRGIIVDSIFRSRDLEMEIDLALEKFELIDKKVDTIYLDGILTNSLFLLNMEIEKY